MSDSAHVFDLHHYIRPTDGRVVYMPRITSLERYTAAMKFKAAMAGTQEATCTLGPINDWFATCECLLKLHQHRSETFKRNMDHTK